MESASSDSDSNEGSFEINDESQSNDDMDKDIKSGEESRDHDYSSINRVMLKCDQKLQQLSFYEYEDDECNEKPVFVEPELLIDVLDFPCVKILC